MCNRSSHKILTLSAPYAGGAAPRCRGGPDELPEMLPHNTPVERLILDRCRDQVSGLAFGRTAPRRFGCFETRREDVTACSSLFLADAEALRDLGPRDFINA